MKLSKILYKIFLCLAAIILPITWFITTNSGLNAILVIVSMFSPMQFNYGQVSGKIIGQPITIQNINLDYKGKKLNVGQLSIDWQLGNLCATNVYGLDQFLPNSKILEYQNMLLEHINAHVSKQDRTYILDVQTTGHTTHAPLFANMRLLNTNKLWSIQHALLNIGANHIDIQQNKITANLISDNLVLGAHKLEAVKIQIHGDLKQHTISATARYAQTPLSIKAQASLDKRIWTAYSIQLGVNNEKFYGNAYADVTHGLNDVNTQLNLHANAQNKLTARVRINHKALNGNVKITAEDLAIIMQLLPDLTRLKGNINANIKIAGTLEKPIIIPEAHITDITATIPRIGIKIKPMELHLQGDNHGKFILSGKGQMRRGSGGFSLTGFLEPFKEGFPNSVTIVGTNVEFINNQIANLTASNKLHLHYAKADKRLDINGDIEIHRGEVTIADKRAQTVKSKDVIFVNEATPHKEQKQLILINPNINLRIAEGVHFRGFGLDADITGKLNISQRHDALYGDGRVTIKKGTYQLPGQKLQINHGRILYPPGTLIANPMLDIKMLSPDLELVVQGTAQKPVISESGLAGNKDRAISQALLTGGNVLSKNLLHEKLKISEIGITSRGSNDLEFFDDPKDKSALKNKDIVIGRSLGRKFYLQYLHSMGEANERLRLKYALNNIWAIGLESGTRGGGADLSFSIERD